MARFKAEEADNYGGQGGGGFFSLKNDKDTAVIRFMYDRAEDVVGDSVHEIEVDGKKRYISCLRNYNDPVDMCPLCAEKYKVFAKLFVPVYDVDADEVKIWDRGKNFISRMSSLVSRYNSLVDTPFEIERNGKKGDTSTTYEFFPMDRDETTLEDLPELPVILGGLVLEKNADEMNFFLDNGFFEDDEAESQDSQAERNPGRDRRPADSKPAQEAPRRRTPASSNNRSQASTTTGRTQANQSKSTARPAGRNRTSNTDRF